MDNITIFQRSNKHSHGATKSQVVALQLKQTLKESSKLTPFQSTRALLTNAISSADGATISELPPLTNVARSIRGWKSGSTKCRQWILDPNNALPSLREPNFQRYNKGYSDGSLRVYEVSAVDFESQHCSAAPIETPLSGVYLWLLGGVLRGLQSVGGGFWTPITPCHP
ncbi:unnamed protein product [Lepeophtheirus salmonis]|uniref:(salmon louse) hypothetical protein n=1 Tax=Lepeophtheirus salmonis TaxID=72036 RepID=A0A7R8GZM0_LEPSM|nr:unnamed protein product [Lepeophtheirus salmonis]CAF2755091.1 unnamed protein product [Lepeophtheirus salmonis]